MKKFLSYTLLTSILFIGFTGCMDSSEVNCSGEVEKGLVEELTLPNMKEGLLVNLLSEDSGDGVLNKAMTYQMLKNVENMGLEADYNKIEGYDSFVSTVEKEFSKYQFEINGIRTTSKDKELDKVECAGTINLQLENYAVEYAVVYDAQLSDDKKEVYVKVTELN